MLGIFSVVNIISIGWNYPHPGFQSPAGLFHLLAGNFLETFIWHLCPRCSDQVPAAELGSKQAWDLEKLKLGSGDRAVHCDDIDEAPFVLGLIFLFFGTVWYEESLVVKLACSNMLF